MRKTHEKIFLFALFALPFLGVISAEKPGYA
jgi:hypothetical protein